MKQEQNKQKIVLIAGLILVAIASLGGYLYNTQQNKIRTIADESLATQQTLSDELIQSRQESDLLNERILQLTRDQAALQGSLAEEQETRQQLQGSLAEEREARQQLQGSLAEEQEARQQLQGSLAEEQEARQQLQTELDAARENRQQIEHAMQAELQSLATVSSELEKELQQRQAQQELLDDKIETVSGEKSQLLTRLESEHEKRRQLQQQIDQVNDDVSNKENALTDAEQAVEQLNTQLTRTREEQDQLKDDIEAINRQREKDSRHFAELEQRLKHELNESRFEISQLKNQMTVIKLTSEVLFNSGSARIKPAGKEVLSLIAESLSSYPDRDINIEGHTDSVPIGKNSPYTSNWELSTARALAAVDYFQQNKQINPQRLKVVGFGEYHPVSSNETTEGRQLNRRIEIRLLPKSLDPDQG